MEENLLLSVKKISKACEPTRALIDMDLEIRRGEVGMFTMTNLTNNFVAAGMTQTAKDIMTGIFLLILLGISANQLKISQWRSNRERAKQIEANYSHEASKIGKV